MLQLKSNPYFPILYYSYIIVWVTRNISLTFHEQFFTPRYVRNNQKIIDLDWECMLIDKLTATVKTISVMGWSYNVEYILDAIF